jgi:hypothetical protein
MADSEIKSKVNRFLIPKVEPLGLAVSVARVVGELITETIAEARKNAPRINPYIGKLPTPDQVDKPLRKSEIGTPVMADVTFNSIKYTDDKGNKITTPEMTFEAILVDVVFPRNIVKTAIQSRNGTVKEYIGEGDAEITFRGVITGNNGFRPRQDIINLLTIIKAPYAIPVTCKFLQDLDIHNVVFEERTFTQEEGGYSYQTFTLNAVSDNPQELTINGM